MAAHTQGPGTPRADAAFLVVLATAALIAFGVALFASLVNLWPVVEAGALSATRASHTRVVRLFFAAVTVRVDSGTALLILATIAGALGSSIHMATSFADYVGNRRFLSSWTPWYLLRPLVGASLALLLYFAIRGGFFSASSESTDVNPYGVAAIAALAGLFSKQATDKLREVFATLFHVSATGGDAQRTDSLTNSVPTAESLEPAELRMGAGDATVIVRGEQFLRGASVVRVNSLDQATRFLNEKELEATLQGELLVSGDTLAITVFNGPPGGGESQPPLRLPVL